MDGDGEATKQVRYCVKAADVDEVDELLSEWAEKHDFRPSYVFDVVRAWLADGYGRAGGVAKD